MIKINSNFSISKDTHGWTLEEKKMTTMTKGRYVGQEREVIRETYHPSTEKVAQAIIGRIGTECESLEELIDAYNNAIPLFSKHVSFICDEDIKEDVKANKKASKPRAIAISKADLNADTEIEEENVKHPAAPLAKKRRRIQKIGK